MGCGSANHRSQSASDGNCSDRQTTNSERKQHGRFSHHRLQLMIIGLEEFFSRSRQYSDIIDRQTVKSIGVTFIALLIAIVLSVIGVFLLIYVSNNDPSRKWENIAIVSTGGAVTFISLLCFCYGCFKYHDIHKQMQRKESEEHTEETAEGAAYELSLMQNQESIIEEVDTHHAAAASDVQWSSEIVSTDEMKPAESAEDSPPAYYDVMGATP